MFKHDFVVVFGSRSLTQSLSKLHAFSLPNLSFLYRLFVILAKSGCECISTQICQRSAALRWNGTKIAILGKRNQKRWHPNGELGRKSRSTATTWNDWFGGLIFWTFRPPQYLFHHPSVRPQFIEYHSSFLSVSILGNIWEIGEWTAWSEPKCRSAEA